MTRIGLIGRGNVGSALAVAIEKSPSLELVEASSADLYIIAVPDGAIAEVVEKLPDDVAVVHTAGSVGMEVLERFEKRGVLYPLQTFTKGRPVDFQTIPLLVEGTFPELMDVAHALSDRVIPANSDVRARVHLAAVFACNFTNRMYAVAGEILGATGLPFDLLAPLISETAAKAIASGDPVTVQTGPAVRDDRSTLDRHRTLLTGTEREIYDLISENIWQISKKI